MCLLSPTLIVSLLSSWDVWLFSQRPCLIREVRNVPTLPYMGLIASRYR